MSQETLPSRNVVIYADSGELHSKITHILEKRCEVRKKKLAVADYVLGKNIACERKTTQDFLQSIIDGRLFRQLAELKEHYNNPVLIIEGRSPFESDRDIHHNAIRGAIASIAIEFAVPIIWTQNQYETAEMLYTIARREQLPAKNAIRIRCKKKVMSMNQLQEFLVSGLPKVSSTTARKMLKYFSTPEKIFTADAAELMKVDGIGKNMAKKIREILAKKYEKSILED